MNSINSNSELTQNRRFGVARLTSTLLLTLGTIIGTFAFSLAAAIPAAAPAAASAPDTVGGHAFGISDVSLLGTQVIPPTPNIAVPAGGTPNNMPEQNTALSIPGSPVADNETSTSIVDTPNGVGTANEVVSNSSQTEGLTVLGGSVPLPLPIPLPLSGALITLTAANSACYSDAFGSTASSSVAGLTIAGTQVPIPTNGSPIALPSQLAAVLSIQANVQVLNNVDASANNGIGSSSITVDALVITVLGVLPGTSVATIILGESSCSVAGPDILATPTVTGLSPAIGKAAGGNTVTITGTGFGDASGVTGAITPVVFFGPNQASSVVVVSPTEITATDPAGTGTDDVQVSTFQDGTSPAVLIGTSAPNSSDQFTYAGIPTIASVGGISPSSGTTAGGTLVTITGTNFIGPITVTFGGVAATSVTQPTFPTTSITAVTPPGAAGPASVVVTTPGGNASGTFTYIQGPAVTAISPAFGTTAGGTTVTITGTNFVSGDTVDFGSVLAASTFVSATQMTAVSPAGSGPVDVTVSQASPALVSATSAADVFTFLGLPSVTSLAPNNGSTVGGTVVTIDGTNFTPTSTVTFGGFNGSNIVFVNSGQITADAPPGIGTVDVIVTNVIGPSPVSAADKYTYTTAPQAPTISGISPNSGPPSGGLVQIVGTNLCGATNIDFGPNPVTQGVQNSSCTVLTVTAPPGMGTVPVTVSTPGGTVASPVGYTYIASGYWEVASDGGIFSFGGAQFYGSTGAIHLNQPIVAMAGTPDDKGYWLFAADGGVFAYGDAQFFGSVPGVLGPQGRTLNAPIVAAQASPDGLGYRMFAGDGGVFDFGDTTYVGSLPGLGITPISPITGAASAPIGNGYVLVGSDGGVFCFGSANFEGSASGLANSPVVALSETPTGDGYYIYTALGEVIPAGDAGSFPPLVSATAFIAYGSSTSDGAGYWLFGTDGNVYAFGDAPNDGTLLGTHLNKPIVGGFGFSET